jgi:hypothetical protein
VADTSTVKGRTEQLAVGHGLHRALHSRHAPHVALGLLVATAFAVYGALSHAAPWPRVFLDELIYMDAASSLADGDGLRVRDEPYSFAVLYPIVLAPLLVAVDRDVGYELVKLANALAFALAAVPIYFLARRVIPPWPSVIAAAASIAVPSAMYTSVVMTESIAYLLSSSAVLAIVLAVERPTLARQGLALAAIAVATLARPQFLVLYAAYVLAVAGAYLLVPQRRRPLRSLPRVLWPTIAAACLGLAVFAVRTASSGGSPAEALGAYSVLWRTYSPGDVGRYLVYELANLELYLAVVPVAVAPIVIAQWLREGRGGAERQAAFAVLFLTVNACLLTLVAAFDSFHVLYLHDRYLFYVAPLWLIALVAWFWTGARRPLIPLAVGVALALSAGMTPLSDLERYREHWRFHALGSTFPIELVDALGSISGARVLLSVGAVLLVAVVFTLSRKAVPVVAAALVFVFAINGAGAWSTALDPPQDVVFAGSREDRRWVDRRVSAQGSVALLYISCERALPRDTWQITTNSVLLTEFFNDSVGRLLHLGGDDRSSIQVEGDGAVVLRSGPSVRAEYVVAQPGVEVVGRRLAEATAGRLVLWQVDGAVRLRDVASSLQLRDATCRVDAELGVY